MTISLGLGLRITQQKPFVESLGPELVTDGDFPSNTNWTEGVDWLIAGGKAAATAANANLSQSLNTTINKTYRVIFTVSDYSAGEVRFRFTGSGNVSGTPRSANGIYTQDILATVTNNLFLLIGFNTFTGKIDDVSCKEVL